MTVKVLGLKEVDDVLNNIAPNQARRLARATITGIAARIRKEARARAPRDTGDLKKAIKSRNERGDPFKPVSSVYVERGRNTRYDAYYWRFIEYGTVNKEAVPFFSPAIDEVRADLTRIVREEFGKKLEKALKRERKKQGLA